MSPAAQIKYGERTFTQAHVDLLDDAGTIMRCQANGDSLCQKMQDELKVNITVNYILVFSPLFLVISFDPPFDIISNMQFFFEF